MENEKVKVVSRGLGFSSILTLIFITLKLLGVITWSWFFVLLPTIISIGFWFLFIVFLIVMLIIAANK